jgi:hypothetical protein
LRELLFGHIISQMLKSVSASNWIRASICRAPICKKSCAALEDIIP